MNDVLGTLEPERAKAICKKIADTYKEEFETKAKETRRKIDLMAKKKK